MPASRLLAAFAAGALVTVPGLALAQGGSPFETPPAETPPVELPTPDEVEATPEVEELELEAEEVEAEEVEAEEDDEGHGETISTLAQCLPSGRELHGTGFTKGFVMSQAASTGEVVIDAHDVAETVATPEDAEALCGIIIAIADRAEAPETAKGRPDWAGPDDDADQGGGDLEAEGAGDAERGGPPPWAGRPGGPKGPR